MTDTVKIPDLKEVKSSNITHVGYDGPEKRLFVRFKSGGLYQYDDFAQHRYDDFMGSDSLGKHFHQNILGKFPHHQIPEK